MEGQWWKIKLKNQGLFILYRAVNVLIRILVPLFITVKILTGINLVKNGVNITESII